jgi:integrase
MARRTSSRSFRLGLSQSAHGGGLVEADVKSDAGRRGIVLPDQPAALLEEHRAAQEREHEHAGTEWHDDGWMFTQENGRPIDPRQDYEEWKQLLKDAGVREARLHDVRHRAATVLLLLGIPPRLAEALMGWSNGAMAKRYQHVTDVMLREIANRINGHLWESN